MKIGSIIKWEEMTDRSFLTMQYDNEDDVMKLLYCISSPKATFEDFKKLPAKHIKRLLSDLEEEIKIMNQFTKESDGNGDTETKITDIAYTLIFAGMSTEYVMDRMTITDLATAMQAYEAKKKEDMEASRLWTYLTMCPHMDSKKIKGPRDIMKFPWEDQLKPKPVSDEAIKVFEDFITGKLKVKWQED